LFANDDIPQSTFVIEYVGEVISQAAFVKRIKKLSSKDHFYFMTMKSDMVKRRSLNYKGYRCFSKGKLE
jgi:SET domain-containing protein